MDALIGHSFSNMLEFLDSCTLFIFNFYAIHMHILCTWGCLSSSFHLFIYYTNQRNKKPIVCIVSFSGDVSWT